MTEIVETGITLDHDEGTIDVSIRSRKIAHRLKSLGFEPENPDSKDYLVFRVKESELKIIFSLPKVKTPAQLKAFAQIRAETSRARRRKQTKKAPPANNADGRDGKGGGRLEEGRVSKETHGNDRRT